MLSCFQLWDRAIIYPGTIILRISVSHGPRIALIIWSRNLAIISMFDRAIRQVMSSWVISVEVLVWRLNFVYLTRYILLLSII